MFAVIPVVFFAVDFVVMVMVNIILYIIFFLPPALSGLGLGLRVQLKLFWDTCCLTHSLIRIFCISDREAKPSFSIRMLSPGAPDRRPNTKDDIVESVAHHR